jgi:hypothetical protein
VIVWAPSELLAPGQNVTVELPIPTQLERPGAYSLKAVFFPNDAASTHESPGAGDHSLMTRDFAVEASAADVTASLCAVPKGELRSRVNFAAAAVPRGQLASLLVACPEEDAKDELFRSGVLFDTVAVHTWMERLRRPTGTLDEADVRALEDATLRIVDLERQAGRIDIVRKSPLGSLARVPLWRVVEERDRYKKGGPARSMDRFRPIFEHEGHRGSIDVALAALTDPAGPRGTPEYGHEDFAILDQMLAQVGASVPEFVVAGRKKNIDALRAAALRAR